MCEERRQRISLVCFVVFFTPDPSRSSDLLRSDPKIGVGRLDSFSIFDFSISSRLLYLLFCTFTVRASLFPLLKSRHFIISHFFTNLILFVWSCRRLCSFLCWGRRGRIRGIGSGPRLHGDVSIDIEGTRQSVVSHVEWAQERGGKLLHRLLRFSKRRGHVVYRLVGRDRIVSLGSLKWVPGTNSGERGHGVFELAITRQQARAKCFPFSMLET